MVCFLLDTVPPLELSRFYAPYEHDPRGAPPYDPAMLVCLWLYADGVGVFSSRKIALACERNLAFLAIVGQDRPAFRTSSDFRTLHLEAFKDMFVQGVRLAAEASLVQWGHVATDGTKIQGKASRHKAMSYGYMQKEVERLREDIEALVTQASQQDEADDAALGSRRGDALPAEWARRAARLARIAAARRRLEAPAQAAAEAERQRRAAAAAERQRTGKKRRGKAPKPGEDSPDDKAQSTLTDPELPSMRTNNKGWEYCGKAHARGDGACQIILACIRRYAVVDLGIKKGIDSRLGGETLCLSHCGYTSWRCCYFTNITTCSAISDAFDSASHEQGTRMLQGTWSGHTLLNLALRLLCTVAGGYLSSMTRSLKSRMPGCWAKPPGAGPVNSAKSCSGGLGRLAGLDRRAGTYPIGLRLWHKGGRPSRPRPGAVELCAEPAHVQAPVCPVRLLVSVKAPPQAASGLRVVLRVSAQEKSASLKAGPLHTYLQQPYWHAIGTLSGGLKVLVVRYRRKYYATNRLSLRAKEVRGTSTANRQEVERGHQNVPEKPSLSLEAYQVGYRRLRR